jgi:hypothetical protein
VPPKRLGFLVVLTLYGVGCAPRLVSRPFPDPRREGLASGRVDEPQEPAEEERDLPASSERARSTQSVAQALDTLTPESEPSATRAPRQRILEAARSRLGRRFRGDCSTFVRTVYAEAGFRFEPKTGRTGSESILRAMKPVERPRPGDVAFFRDSYGKVYGPGPNRRLTHVAVVEAVDGTSIIMIHRGHKGIARIKLDLERPHDRRANSQLRMRRRKDPKGLEYLTGELLTDFAAHREIVAIEEAPVG